MGPSAHRGRSLSEPRLHFSYGMTKSGSTLAFELARTGLELAGLAQPKLSDKAVRKAGKINFTLHIDAAQADQIRAEVGSIGHKILFKTHTRPDPAVIDMLISGEAAAHAIFRDPRDMALSMLDHGAKARHRQAQPFAEFVRLEDTIENIAHQSNSLLAWLSLPNVRPFSYDQIAFGGPEICAQLLMETGAKADAQMVRDTVMNNRFTQFNRGETGRWRREMDPLWARRFEELFPGLIDLVQRADTLPRDGRPLLDPNIPLANWERIDQGDFS